MRIPGRVGLLGTLLCLVACNEEPVGPRPVPTTVMIVAGEGQRGVVGQALDTALSVLITDKFGDPVPGVLVRFAAPPGGGEFVPVTQTTGPGGQARSIWTLPLKAGARTATVLAGGLDPLEFHAVAAPGPPASLMFVSTDSGRSSPTPPGDSLIAVVVRDAYGNAVPGASVTFSVLSGAGSVDPESRETDTTGQARATWSLGTEAGPQTLGVGIDTLHPIHLQARARVPAMTFRAMSNFSAAQALVDGGSASALPSGAEAGQLWSRPQPALACWINALGPVPLADPGDVDPLADPGPCSTAPLQ